MLSIIYYIGSDIIFEGKQPATGMIVLLKNHNAEIVFCQMDCCRNTRNTRSCNYYVLTSFQAIPTLNLQSAQFNNK